MKKLILLTITILVLGGAAIADDFLDSTREMCSMVKQNLSLSTNSPKVADSIITKYIREAYCILAPAVAAMSFMDTILTVAYTQVYDLDSHLIQVEKVYFVNKDTLIPLHHIPTGGLDTLYPSGYTLAGKNGWEAHPSYYDWSIAVWNSSYHRLHITFYPIPVGTGDTIIVEGVSKVGGIASDSTFTSEFPVSYRPLAVAWATSATALHLGRLDLSNIYFQRYMHILQIMNITVSSGLKSEGQELVIPMKVQLGIN